MTKKKPFTTFLREDFQEGQAEVSGRVERRIFHNEDNGYTILAVHDRRRGPVVVIASSLSPPSGGDHVTARGVWKLHKGERQLRAASLEVSIDRSDDALAGWVRSQGIEGVGDRTILKLKVRFPGRLADVIGDEAALIAGGVQRRQAFAIAKAWRDNRRRAEYVAALMEMGLTPKQVRGVEETFGAAGVEVARQNPWRLCEEVEGIGFPTCDTIAERLGMDMKSPMRVLAGLRWVLQDNLVRNGHVGVPEEHLVAHAARLLKVQDADARAAVPALFEGGRVIRDGLTGFIYPKILHDDECAVASRLVRLRDMGTALSTPAQAEQALLAAEEAMGLTLDREGGQWDAAMAALTEPVAVVTGGPGTGKSTIQKVVAHAITSLGLSVIFAAPTGRAARRLAETSGHEAGTVHRLLEFAPELGRFTRDEARPLSCNALVVDEMSMTDVRITACLLRAVKLGTSLLLVGDYDQLPSVGPGQVLRDVIESGEIPVVRLTRVRRQAAGSGIAMAAARVNAGRAPWEGEEALPDDMLCLDRDDERVADTVLTLVERLEATGYRPLHDIQVLASMRKGDSGVNSLNAILKDRLNPVVEGDGESVRLDARFFTLRDRVMQLKNNYGMGVFNGEVGSVVEVVERDEDGKPFVVVDFSGTRAKYNNENADEIVHAYAVTVHKSQGCEFPCVIVSCPEAHRRMLSRNLLYTAMTRARARCILVGPLGTVARAARTEDVFRRYTGLVQRLRLEGGRR